MAENRAGQNRPKSGQSTLVDISKELGVSIATVSRVINDKPGVGARLREKVMAVVRKHKYMARVGARDLISGKRGTLGVVFQDLTAGWLLTIFRGVLTKCTLAGYHVVTTLSIREGDETDLPEAVTAGQRVDGFVWLDPRLKHEHIEQVKAQGIPFVLIENYSDEAEVSSVSVENTHAACLAAKHLLGLGHKNLLVITGPKDDPASQQRLAGVQLAMKETGIQLPEDNILCGHYDGLIAVDVLSTYLRSHPLPAAIFAFNDGMALALLHWLRAQGHRVPEDVAIMGFDGIDDAQKENLTTVETPMKEMGILATQLLVQMVENPGEDRQVQHILLKGKLAVRDTCGAHLTDKETSGRMTLDKGSRSQ
ncbi:MAG: LacI family DNA-binding transcriptional regulator [bacterium]